MNPKTQSQNGHNAFLFQKRRCDGTLQLWGETV